MWLRQGQEGAAGGGLQRNCNSQRSLRSLSVLRNRLSSADASHVILTPLRSGSYSHPHFIREEMEAQREPAQYHTACNRWRRGLNQRVCTAEPCPWRQVKPQDPEPGISEALLDFGLRALGNHRRALSRRKTWSGSLFTEEEQMGGQECRQRAGPRDPALDQDPRTHQVQPCSPVGGCCHHLYLQGNQGLQQVGA